MKKTVFVAALMIAVISVTARGQGEAEKTTKPETTMSFFHHEESSENDGSEKEGDRIEELRDSYPDITVANGGYDNDMIFNAVCEAVEKHDAQLVVYRDTGDIIQDFWKFKAASNFQYFWLDGINAQNYTDYTVMTFNYLYDEAQTESMINEIDAVYRNYEYDLAGERDEWKVAEYLYNSFANEITYNNDGSNNIRNIYGALVEKKAVCAGYTAAFDYVMSRMGYDVGVAGNNDHIWNYMAWDSDDCFIDATWGDLNEYDQYGREYIDYSYFGMNSDELSVLEDHAITYAYISGRSYNQSDVTASDYTGSTNKNYCDIKSLNAGSYSYNLVEDIFHRQYLSGANSFVVKFNSQAEVEAAAATLTGNDFATLNQMLSDLGIYGPYTYRVNTACKTFEINIMA